VSRPSYGELLFRAGRVDEAASVLQRANDNLPGSSGSGLVVGGGKSEGGGGGGDSGGPYDGLVGRVGLKALLALGKNHMFVGKADEACGL